MVEPKDVVAKINQLRIARGWSVYKLAEEAVLTQSTVANMFSRGTVPTIPTLKQICDAFGLSLAEFFDGGEAQSQQTFLSQFNQLEHADREVVKKMTEFLAKKQQNFVHGK